MRLRVIDILKEKGKTKYWLYIQMGLSYQNFSRIINNQTTAIKFDNLKALCDILDCTPNDLFDEYCNRFRQFRNISERSPRRAYRRAIPFCYVNLRTKYNYFTV